MGRVWASVRVNGIVQGVGFRPFIHREVERRRLTGWIRNNSEGVEMELEGECESLERFLAVLPERSPALALVESISCQWLDELVGYTGFQIIPSQTLAQLHHPHQRGCGGRQEDHLRV